MGPYTSIVKMNAFRTTCSRLSRNTFIPFCVHRDALEEKTSKDSHPRIWVDCEMTGLNSETDQILEIFCIITNSQLETLDDAGWGCVVHHPQSTLSAMGEWCTNMHASTGLTAKVLSSTTTPEDAAAGLLEYIQRYVPEKGQGLLAGNSVHADKAFLSKGPYNAVLEHLHYRIVDVSSIYECVIAWCGLDVLMGIPSKKKRHTAKEDILESIAEARYYKDAIFARK
ncbi:ribonuclease H-like domain-containing protein [Calycina marina]|uniref:Ribonuclease H-like domain-containing protein n=1 Tax=Calycina marina TaxID=1763456 RepID=A0A9P7Z5U9_9HELO|nr:ribonuclease H-like domain-containing protein [Calycina marina]